jgi:hypothetical protein
MFDQYFDQIAYAIANGLLAMVGASAGSGVNRQLDGSEPIDMGSDFYAHIRHTSSGLYLTDRDYNVSAQPGVFDGSQTWHFVRQGNGSYTISSNGDYHMDVAAADYNDGVNIQMYPGNGSAAQTFFVYYIHGNYYLKTVPEDKVLDVDAGTKNLQLFGNTSGVFSTEFEKNARSFEILKLQIDGSAWNATLGSQFECYVRNWHTGHLMTAEGDNVIFRDPSFSDNQKWIVTRNEYGGHEIKSAVTGKVLDVAGAAIDHGTDINLWDPNGSKAQNFFFIDTGEARFYIKPSYANLVVDMDAGNMEIHACGYGTGGSQLIAQVFEFITVNQIKDDLTQSAPQYLGERFTAKIHSQAFNKYLTDNNGVSMQDASNGNNQVWSFTYDSKWQAYKIIGSSGKALDVAAGMWANGAQLHTYDSNDTAAQRFRFYFTDGGYYISPANTQKIVDIDTNTGSIVHLYGNSPSENRVFGISLVTFDGKSPVNRGETFTTYIKNKATGLFLTSADSGTLKCTSTQSKWTFKRHSDGSYEIISKDFNKALDVQGGNVADGTGLHLWDANGSYAQRFFIYDTGNGYILRSAKGLGCIDMDMNSKDVHIYASIDGKARDQHVFEFEPASVTSISVSKNPNKTTYTEGETLDTTGLTITAKYSDNTTKTITTGFTVSPSGALTTVGTNKITVTYGGKTTSFNVTVNKKPVTLSSISVSKNPNKTTYTEGEALDTTGLTITAKYSDNTTKTITTGFTVSPSGALTTAGTNEITVTYGGKTTSFNVTVNKKAEEKLVIKSTSKYEKADSYLKNVAQESTAASIISQFDNVNVVIYDANGNQVSANAICGTGCTVNLISGDKIVDSLEIIVLGDVDGNGVVDSTDYMRVKSMFLGSYTLTGSAFVAGDVEVSGEIDSTDYLRLKSAFMGTYVL